MNVTLIGSFRKYYKEICDAYEIFEQNGIAILSPKKSRILNPNDEFVFLKSDPQNVGIKAIEDVVLDAIDNSDFIYLVNPFGYIGISVGFELGHCIAKQKPVYSSDPISEVSLQPLIKGFYFGVYSPEKLLSHLANSYCI